MVRAVTLGSSHQRPLKTTLLSTFLDGYFFPKVQSRTEALNTTHNKNYKCLICNYKTLVK